MIRLSLRRPVAVAMIYLSVALLGVAAWRGIPIELLPDAGFPRLSLNVEWPGASPETLEAFATTSLEAAVQRVKGVERITSTTWENHASIEVEFAQGTDMDFARVELSERLATVEEELPDGVRQIQVQPYVPREFEREVSRPFLAYTLTAPLLVEALRLHMDEVVAPELLQVRGVSGVEIQGGRTRLLEIELAPARIAALGLRAEQVAQAIDQLDLVREAGAVRSDGREWVVTVRSRPGAAADLHSSLLPVNGPRPVRLDDVAVIRDTFEDPRFHYRINGSPAVGFTVHKEFGINTVRLAEAVKGRMAELEGLHPPGTQIILNDDQSEDIRRHLTDLRTRAGVAAGVIFMVLLAFLRSFRTAGIVFATIAFSIAIALNFIYFGGLTLNLLSLMGLGLGFGLIVDNSIVVLESVDRKWQEGAEPRQAAEKGAREVFLPVLASTFTSLVVFLPFLYLQGELRIYYLPLAIVVGLALLASVFTAFTFIPALAARLLGTGGGTGRGRGERTLGSRDAPRTSGSLGKGDSVAFPAFASGRPPVYIRFYGGLLETALRFPWVAVLVAALCFGGTWRLFDTYVSRGVVWGGGGLAQRSSVVINIDMPRGSDLERVDELTRFFEERLARSSEVEVFTTQVGGASSRIQVDFPEELEFTPIPLLVEERLKAFSLGFTGAEVRVYGQGPSFYGGSGGSAPNYRITLLGYNYDRLAEIADDLGRRLERHARISEVDTNASAGFFVRDRVTEFTATLDREAVARHAITVAEATGLLLSALRGTGRSGLLMLGGEEVAYEVKLEGYREMDVKGLLEMMVATSEGNRLPLGDLVAVRERRVLTSIRRENQQYERTVAYEFRGPVHLGDLIRDSALEATVLPPGYAIQERTPWQVSTQDQNQFRLVLLVSIGLVFMVTAGLFESVRQPLCVLMAVPMALIGVFLIFFYANATFTREAHIGVILMVGIVVNNAILLVDQINRVRAETDLTLFDAIIRGTLERVRPILMTTATTVLGLLPLVLFTPSADATIWNALAYALIGGLLSSTIFVLTTTPALYWLFERRACGSTNPCQRIVDRGFSG